MEYRHFRHRDADKVILPNGGVSFGIIRTENSVKVYVANCSMLDTFNKKTARSILQERAEKGDIAVEIDIELIKLYLQDFKLEYFRGVNTAFATKIIENLTIEDISIKLIIDMVATF
jgi:hypothetical protein